MNDTHAETSSCAAESPTDELRLRVTGSQWFEATTDITTQHLVTITQELLSPYFTM